MQVDHEKPWVHHASRRGGGVAPHGARAAAGKITARRRVGVRVAAASVRRSPQTWFTNSWLFEGRNIALEVRYSGGRSDRAGEIATEFVRLGVDVIVAHFTPAVRARAVGRTKLATDGARRKAGRSKKSDGRQLRSQTNGQPVGLWADGLFQQKRVVIRIRPEDSR